MSSFFTFTDASRESVASNALAKADDRQTPLDRSMITNVVCSLCVQQGRGGEGRGGEERGGKGGGTCMPSN